MRQLRRRDVRSPVARAEIEAIWRDSLKVASLCYVIAKHYSRVNADQAMLTGLLHGLGRLYIVMRAEELTDVSTVNIREVAAGWQAVIGKAILESWGLPEPLQHAVEHSGRQSPIRILSTSISASRRRLLMTFSCARSSIGPMRTR